MYSQIERTDLTLNWINLAILGTITGMRQACWCAVGVGLVFEVPPFVGVDAVEVVAAAVPFQPACALEGSHVERDAADVFGFGGWQHPCAGGFR